MALLLHVLLGPELALSEGVVPVLSQLCSYSQEPNIYGHKVTARLANRGQAGLAGAVLGYGSERVLKELVTVSRVEVSRKK